MENFKIEVEKIQSYGWNLYNSIRNEDFVNKLKPFIIALHMTSNESDIQVYSTTVHVDDYECYIRKCKFGPVENKSEYRIQVFDKDGSDWTIADVLYDAWITLTKV